LRLVFVTQTLDADHPVLAQTLDLVGALAERFDEVAVLCARVGRHELPANVRVHTFGAQRRLSRGVRFVRELAAELRREPRPDAVLAHMVPLFLLLAAPLAKPRGVPLVLWYQHGMASRALKLAVRLADVVVTADVRSFPLRSAKVRGIGHAIDVERFSPATVRPTGDGRLRLLALGRFSWVKGYDTLLDGFGLAVERGLDAQLELRGPQLTEAERRHHAELEELVRRSPVLSGRVELADSVPRDLVPELLRSTDGVLSATHARDSETFDKVVVEAGACGVPVLADNSALDELLGDLPVDLRFRSRDPESLAERLLAFAAAGPERRAEAGAELRRRVEAGHSVDSWADAVTKIVAAQTRE
jgi:glycosyltransferase involved in cell wall biosynthesis